MQVDPQEFGKLQGAAEANRDMIKANHDMLVDITTNGTKNSLNIKWVWRIVLFLGVAMKAAFWFLYIQITSATSG